MLEPQREIASSDQASFDAVSLPIDRTGHSISFESSHFDISFERNGKLVRDFCVELYDDSAVHVGRLTFGPMTLADSKQFSEELLGLGKNPPDSSLPASLRAIELLRSCLAHADKREIPYQSSLGTGLSEIVAEFGDAITDPLPLSHHRDLLEVKEIQPGIYSVVAPTNYQLASTFLRLQERFESPRFRGKVFDRDTYKDWYRTTSQTENFSYYDDWGGFNLPDHIVDPFLGHQFDPLSNKERALLSYFRNTPRPFYIIGTSASDSSVQVTMKHELRHALYYLNAEYREKVQEALKEVPTRKIQNYLRRTGYDDSTIEDETHAYLADPLSYLVENAGIERERYESVHRKLQRLFKKYYAHEKG